MNWISYILALAAGAVNPAQSGANAQLNNCLNRPISTGIWIYASGLIGMILVLIVAREPVPSAGQLSQPPWWAWLGGLISIASTLAGLTFAQKMGSGAFTGLSVTAAVVASILVDHFGLIGFKVHPATPMRIAGGALMIAGLWLVSKF